jgi:DNA-binding CsgD family transcriptional regulator
VIALCVAGRLAARQGDPRSADLLDEALELALGAGSMQRIVPVRAARAEAALLRGDREAALGEARGALEMTVRMGQPWYAGDLSVSLLRAGGAVVPPERCAAPHVLEMAGRWQEAANEWQALSCPYEQARALSQGDEPARFQALALLDGLGAIPAAEAVRRSLRAGGVRGVPRGPRLSTQRNPLGLTNRELEIARMLCDGLRNSEIAERLYRSVRTIENHVDSIFDKLCVSSRGEVPEVLRSQGLLEPATWSSAPMDRRAS